jgi:hypothetical protein
MVVVSWVREEFRVIGTSFGPVKQGEGDSHGAHEFLENDNEFKSGTLHAIHAGCQFT